MYDPKCLDLATTFLEDHPKLNTEKNRDALAQEIQRAIEDWISYEEDAAAEAQR